MRDMKSQYQTCFGLGVPFANDATRKGGKRARGAQRRALWRNQNSYQNSPQLGSPFAVSVAGGRGRGERGLTQQELGWLRSRGICFDFRAGSCGRGAACKFLHTT